jgi:hypothetical protein
MPPRKDRFSGRNSRSGARMARSVADPYIAADWEGQYNPPALGGVYSDTRITDLCP